MVRGDPYGLTGLTHFDHWNDHYDQVGLKWVHSGKRSNIMVKQPIPSHFFVRAPQVALRQ